MKHRRKAAALKYEDNLKAPIVTAAGAGYVADKIIEEAKLNNVPVVYNKELSELLSNVEVGDYIPTELYEAVAYVIAYIASVDKLIDER